MKTILNENFKAFCYFLFGVFFTIAFSTPILDKINFKKEVGIAYLSTLQSCTFSLTKHGKLSNEEIRKFCISHSNNFREDFSDVSAQMNEIISKKKFSINDFN